MNARLDRARKQRLVHRRKDDLLRYILRAANLDRAQNLEVVKILFPEMYTETQEYNAHCRDGDLASLVGDLFSLKFMEYAIGVRGKVNMGWTQLKNERDKSGALTPLARALDALSNHGCDCGTDEPGSCIACLCEAALRDLWSRQREVRG